MQELIGMTITEAAKHIDNPDTMVKVGAKKGTAFIFCGPVSDLLKGLSEQELKYYSQSVKSIAKQKIKLDNMLCSFPTLESYARSVYEESQGTDVGTFEGWEEAIKQYFKLLQRNKQRLVGMEARFENRIPLKNRKILDAYTSIREPNTWIFLVEGYEKGDYWDRHEYVNGVDEDEDEGESADTDRSSAEQGGKEEA